VSGHPPAETWRKVGVRTGQRLVLRHAPREWGEGSLPAGVTLSTRRGVQPAAVVVAFYRSLAELRRDAGGLSDWITPDGVAWVAWPRNAAGHVSDLSDNAVRDVVLPTGLVDVKVAALDEDWSALRFVWRLERRAALRR
jgi:hypothetical protein